MDLDGRRIMEEVLGWGGPVGLGIFFSGLGIFWWGLRHLSEIRGGKWNRGRKTADD